MAEQIKPSEDKGLVDFIANNQAMTLAVPIDDDGTLHAFSMLYYSTPDPLKFYMITAKDTDKYRLLATVKSVNCAAVVGTERGTSYSIQMRGELYEVDHNGVQDIIDDYYKKLDNHWDDINEPNHALLVFEPNWARYTDYSKGYARHFLELGK